MINIDLRSMGSISKLVESQYDKQNGYYAGGDLKGDEVDARIKLTLPMHGSLVYTKVPEANFKDLPGTYRFILHTDGSAFHKSPTEGTGFIVGKVEDVAFTLYGKSFKLSGHSDWQDIAQYEFNARRTSLASKHFFPSIAKIIYSFVHERANEFMDEINKILKEEAKRSEPGSPMYPTKGKRVLITTKERSILASKAAEAVADELRHPNTTRFVKKYDMGYSVITLEGHQIPVTSKKHMVRADYVLRVRGRTPYGDLVGRATHGIAIGEDFYAFQKNLEKALHNSINEIGNIF